MATASPTLDPVRVGPLVVAGAAGFALASSLVAVLPAFRFESQFPALLPLIAWAAAAGIGPLMLGARRLLDPGAPPTA